MRGSSSKLGSALAGLANQEETETLRTCSKEPLFFCRRASPLSCFPAQPDSLLSHTSHWTIPIIFTHCLLYRHLVFKHNDITLSKINNFKNDNKSSPVTPRLEGTGRLY